MTQVHDIGIIGGDPLSLSKPLLRAALPAPDSPHYEAAVVRAALDWFRVMLDSGSDLDRTTLAFVYGRDAAPAALNLMDACHDVEARRGGLRLA